MARLRPSWLFRRLSSRDSKDTSRSRRTTDSSISPPASPSTASDFPSSPNPPTYSVASTPASRKLRKSSSLPKVRRRKLNSQGATELEVPDIVEEKRESVLGPELAAEEQHATGQQTTTGRDSQQRTPNISTEDLQLRKADRSGSNNHPILLVRQPTEDVDVIAGRDSEE